MRIVEEVSTGTAHIVLPDIVLFQTKGRGSKPLARLTVQVIIVQMTLEISKGFKVLFESTEIAKVVLQGGQKMTAVSHIAGEANLAAVAEEFGGHLKRRSRFFRDIFSVDSKQEGLCS